MGWLQIKFLVCMRIVLVKFAIGEVPSVVCVFLATTCFSLVDCVHLLAALGNLYGKPVCGSRMRLAVLYRLLHSSVVSLHCVCCRMVLFSFMDRCFYMYACVCVKHGCLDHTMRY